MKKTLIIVLCCLTAMLAACNKEKPNEKFIGDYEGNGLINGTMTVLTFNQEFTDVELPMKFNIAPGDADDKVILTYINDELDETYTATGTVTNNNVEFDPVNVSTMVENYVVDATLNMTGTLAGTTLSIDGTVTGGGTYIDVNTGLQIPYTIQGTVVGTVEKIVVTE